MAIETPPWLVDATLPVPGLDPASDARARLVAASDLLLTHFLEILPRIHMMMTYKPESRRAMSHDAQSPPMRSLLAIEGFLARPELGVDDPQLRARALIGAIHHFAFWQHAGLDRFAPYERERYVRRVVALCLCATSLDASSESSP